MAINERQFEQLSAMGISLYTRKQVDTVDEQNDTLLEISKKDIQSSQFVADILQCLNCDYADITINQFSIDLPKLCWQFQLDASPILNQTTLITPPLDELIKSASTKKELWRLLSQVEHS